MYHTTINLLCQSGIPPYAIHSISQSQNGGDVKRNDETISLAAILEAHGPYATGRIIDAAGTLVEGEESRLALVKYANDLSNRIRKEYDERRRAMIRRHSEELNGLETGARMELYAAQEIVLTQGIPPCK